MIKHLQDAVDKGWLSDKGLSKIFEHRLTNRLKYGSDVHKEYDDAMESCDKERIEKCFFDVEGARFVKVVE